MNGVEILHTEFRVEAFCEQSSESSIVGLRLLTRSRTLQKHHNNIVHNESNSSSNILAD